jgi:5'-3' exonuclease
MNFPEIKMGVKDLMSILRTKCPQVLKTGAPFAMTRAWIDTPLIIVASCKKAESEGHDPFLLVEQSLRKTLNQISAMGCNDIQWIFDGRGRPEKKRTIIGRSQNHAAYSKRCEKKAEERSVLLDDLTFAEIAYASMFPSKKVSIREINNYAMQILRDFPNSFVSVAKHDSEEHIARVMNETEVAFTNDSDALVFGCSTIVQNFGSCNETWIQLEDVLQALNMTIHDLRLLAIFLGNDFNARRSKMGPVAAFKAAEEKKTIDDYGSGDDEWKKDAHASYKVFSG